MTNLEKLIRGHTEHAAVTTISQATERLAEELAREMLKDPKTRAELQNAVRDAFTGTMTALRNGRRRKAKR